MLRLGFSGTGTFGWLRALKVEEARVPVHFVCRPTQGGAVTDLVGNVSTYECSRWLGTLRTWYLSGAVGLGKVPN